jgi:hypothetical protein
MRIQPDLPVAESLLGFPSIDLGRWLGYKTESETSCLRLLLKDRLQPQEHTD